MGLISAVPSVGQCWFLVSIACMLALRSGSNIGGSFSRTVLVFSEYCQLAGLKEMGLISAVPSVGQCWFSSEYCQLAGLKEMGLISAVPSVGQCWFSSEYCLYAGLEKWV